ncbi:ATP-binding protein [Crossiella cryophila]|uniref:Tetratricopeptide (TPR) repeat protein n=1 Tax=Crossiella cryophila TaxID=43355 RepID=A0A7W7CHN7_9PSEU|nr:tetratricopeptide repeat protein [Crossiella cryophila]MBB4679908.1 tetratricopeptide (TPR) repeat protein [Crossiella cryophila]
MADPPGAHNQFRGGDPGAVVQAGSIHHLTFTGTGTPPVVPRQLPLAVPGFTGRAEQLAALDALLAEGGAVVISAVDGTAGVGKTTLAVHWAHRVQQHFPDGTLFVNLRGYGPATPANPEEVLAGFLQALGVAAERIPLGVEAQAGLYRSVLAGRRVLIVLDNANAVEQVRSLLPGSPGCMVLITSRSSLTGLVVGEAANRFTLDLLNPAEAYQLLRTTLGEARIAAEPLAVAALIRYCARLPLALRIAAAHPYATVGELVTEMAEDRARLDILSDTGDQTLAVRAVFDWSYRKLADEQARMFRRLGLHPGPEISLPVAAALGETGLNPARRLLSALADAHLLQRVARDRYRLHDLLRAYAAELVETEDCARLQRILFEWYAHHAKVAYQVAAPALASWFPILETPTAAHPVITFSEAAVAWGWAAEERDNLVAVARSSADCAEEDLALVLLTAVVGFLFARESAVDELELNRLRLQLARRVGNRVAEVAALNCMGVTLQELSLLEEAFQAYQGAAGLARELGDRRREAGALLNLGYWCNHQERYVEALDYLQEALPLSGGAQRGRQEGAIESHLSVAHAGLGNYEQALRHAKRAVVLQRQAPDRLAESWSLELMARAHQGLRAHRQAVALYEQSLSTNEYRPYGRARCLQMLGISLCHMGETARAIECWQEALAIFEDFGDHRATSVQALLTQAKPTHPPPTTPPQPPPPA